MDSAAAIAPPTNTNVVPEKIADVVETKNLGDVDAGSEVVGSDDTLTVSIESVAKTEDVTTVLKALDSVVKIEDVVETENHGNVDEGNESVSLEAEVIAKMKLNDNGDSSSDGQKTRISKDVANPSPTVADIVSEKISDDVEKEEIFDEEFLDFFKNVTVSVESVVEPSEDMESSGADYSGQPGVTENSQSDNDDVIAAGSVSDSKEAASGDINNK